MKKLLLLFPLLLSGQTAPTGSVTTGTFVVARSGTAECTIFKKKLTVYVTCTLDGRPDKIMAMQAIPLVGDNTGIVGSTNDGSTEPGITFIFKQVVPGQITYDISVDSSAPHKIGVL